MSSGGADGRESSSSRASEESERPIDSINAGRGIQAGDVNVQVNASVSDEEMLAKVRVFLESARDRENFMTAFLNQALRQAKTTFQLSAAFMAAGGLIVLGAAVIAIGGFVGSPSHAVALVSGIAGILIGGSGSAFLARSAKARKHLADRAAAMHEQLINERRFYDVANLITGIKDSQLNDQARLALAARLIGEVEDRQLTPLPQGAATGGLSVQAALDSRLLESMEPEVGYDIAQISSSAGLSPSQCRSALESLSSVGLIREVKDHRGFSRYVRVSEARKG